MRKRPEVSPEESSGRRNRAGYHGPRLPTSCRASARRPGSRPRAHSPPPRVGPAAASTAPLLGSSPDAGGVSGDSEIPGARCAERRGGSGASVECPVELPVAVPTSSPGSPGVSRKIGGSRRALPIPGSVRDSAPLRREPAAGFDFVRREVADRLPRRSAWRRGAPDRGGIRGAGSGGRDPGDGIRGRGVLRRAGGGGPVLLRGSPRTGPPGWRRASAR